MNTLRIFFSEFWPFFIVGIFVLPLVQWGKHVSLGGNATMFISPNSFKGLSSFPKDEKKRLLHEADGDAFPGWRFFFPVLIYVAIVSGSVALALTLPKVTTLPDSMWAGAGMAGLFVGLGIWLAWRWELRRVTPFLKTHVERTHHAA